MNQNYGLEIINNSLPENIITYKLESDPKKIYTCEDIVCINLGTEILFINNSGWLLKRYKSSQEVRDLILGDGIAGIVYKDKIELISF